MNVFVTKRGAVEYYNRVLSLPMFTTLTDKQQTYVIQCAYDFFDGGRNGL